jgi:hypothetical protein
MSKKPHVETNLPNAIWWRLDSSLERERDKGWVMLRWVWEKVIMRLISQYLI